EERGLGSLLCRRGAGRAAVPLGAGGGGAPRVGEVRHAGAVLAEPRRERRDALAGDDRGLGTAAEPARQRQRFERGLPNLPVPLLDEDQEFHRTLASSRRRRTSSFAAAAGSSAGGRVAASRGGGGPPLLPA